jgi:hypothetical protein
MYDRLLSLGGYRRGLSIARLKSRGK